MPSFIADHPMLCAVALIFIDIAVWRLISADLANWKLAARLAIFAVFSAVLFNDGMNPMQLAPYGDNTALHLAATALQIGWWLFAARTLTVLLGTVMMNRVGHGGRLLQDLLGAVIFLIAIIAAMAYVLDLPVKGVLATSGAVAIIVGLALQSTLSDVFSGIVLNTTKPYQVDDWISIDGTEGRVTDIDWRATRLQTSQGSMAVLPGGQGQDHQLLTPGGHVRPGGQPASQPACAPANRDRSAGACDARLPAFAGQTRAQRGVQDLRQWRRGIRDQRVRAGHGPKA
jgi:small-conductance mechanosensitive channel